MNNSIKNNLIKMYDESSYSDKYGLHIWIVSLTSLLVLFIVLYFYILNNLQPIKADWNKEKCNPVYIPFAGVIHDKKGDEFYSFTANNFTGCIQTVLEKITKNALTPFYYSMNVISNVFLVALNSLAAIREMLNKLRLMVSNITIVIYKKISNIITPIIEIFINIKSIIGKFTGTVATIVYSLIGSYLALKSFFKVVIQLIVNILYIISAIIVSLLLLGWFFPFSLPLAIALATSMTVILIIVIVIKVMLSDVLKIQTAGLPSVPSI